MMAYISRTCDFLRAFVEMLFYFVLAVVLVYLVLGESSGVFVKSVADNVIKFSTAVPTPSLVGIAIILALVYVVMQRGTARK